QLSAISYQLSAISYQLSAGLNPTDERGEHPLDFADGLVQGLVSIIRKIVQVMSEQKLVLGFARGAGRDPQKPREIAVSIPTAAFGDVRRNGHRGTSQLRSQPEEFVLRERLRRLIDRERQPMSFLPHEEVAKILHLHSSLG
ncbi:MAG: hypothetical protein WD069_09885, partial [Planctomycetales bacterium]